MSVLCFWPARSGSLDFVEQLDQAAQVVRREQLIVEQIVQVQNEVHVDVALHDLLPVLLDEQLTS